jgi:hypothetical protein
LGGKAGMMLFRIEGTAQWAICLPKKNSLLRRTGPHINRKGPARGKKKRNTALAANLHETAQMEYRKSGYIGFVIIGENGRLYTSFLPCALVIIWQVILKII